MDRLLVKHMKKIAIFAGIVLVSIALAGCYWTAPPGDTGGLKLTMGEDFSSRALPEGTNAARVYLLSQTEAFYNFGTEDAEELFFEEDGIAEGSTIAIPGIPATDWYVFLVLGKKSTTDGTFVPTASGSSLDAAGSLIPVSITAGDAPTSVSITTETIDFVWAENLSGVPLTGVVTYGTEIFASSRTEDVLYNGSGMDNMTAMTDFPTTYDINSVSKGEWFSGGASAPELWVNTASGIVPYRGSAFVTNFQSASPFGIMKSGALYDGDTDEVTIFYKSEDGFGGLLIAEADKDTPAVWDWTNFNEFEEQFTGELVYDFFTYSNFAYFATKLGAFRMDESSVSSGGDSDFLALVDFFEIIGPDGEVLPISGLAYVPTAKMLLATDGGVFPVALASIDAGGTTLEGIAPISGTEDIAFTHVAVSDDGTYAAAVSNVDLFLFKDVAGTYNSNYLRFHTGFPGGVTALAWKEGGTELYITGSGSAISPAGLVSIDAAAQPW